MMLNWDGLHIFGGVESGGWESWRFVRHFVANFLKLRYNDW